MKPDNRILLGLEHLLRNDIYLLANDVGERAITHKLGEYYQWLFSEWNVDCEYDRNLNGPKIINIDVPLILKLMRKSLENKTGQILELLESIEVAKADVELILQQLENPQLEYNEELDVIYHVLELRDDKKLKKNIAPDIIIHHRGTKENYIVIEAKRTKNRNSVDRAYDLIKLFTLVTSLEYKYKEGIFIDIPVNQDLNRFESFVLANKHHKQVFSIMPKYK